jgi:hypothetical protein
MDLLWFDTDARPAAAEHLRPHRHFAGIDTAMLRGDWGSPETSYLGIKGGTNGSCHHAHLDLGSFVLDAGGVRWAIDLGPDDYHLPDYFNPEARARYYRTNTLGHNTIVIDGHSQPPTARAPILLARFAPGLSRIVLDMTEACPGSVRARRGFGLINGRDVIIVDEIDPARPLASIVWQMHTAATIAPPGRSAELTQTGAGAASARLFLRILQPEDRMFAVADASPSGPAGQNPNAGIVKLVVNCAQVAAPLRLAVLLSPDEAACAAPDLPEIARLPIDEWGR